MEQRCGEEAGQLVTGLSPAFRDTRTGETHLASTALGEPSELHEFSYLPDHWVAERDASGEPVALHPAIVAGYHRFDRFLPIGSAFVLPIDA